MIILSRSLMKRKARLFVPQFIHYTKIKFCASQCGITSLISSVSAAILCIGMQSTCVSYKSVYLYLKCQLPAKKSGGARVCACRKLEDDLRRASSSSEPLLHAIAPP